MLVIPAVAEGTGGVAVVVAADSGTAEAGAADPGIAETGEGEALGREAGAEAGESGREGVLGRPTAVVRCVSRLWRCPCAPVETHDYHQNQQTRKCTTISHQGAATEHSAMRKTAESSLKTF